MVQGHHHGPRGRLSRHSVSQHERRERGRPVGLARHLGEAAGGLGQGAEAGPIAVGPTSAVPADVQHHQLRVAGVDGFVVETPPGQCAGPVADHQDIAHRQELVEEVLALELAEVEGDTALVPADALPHQPDAVLPVAPRAQGIARPGLLDLDDLGPELAQGGGHHGTGDQCGRVDHAEPVQGPG